MYLSARSTRKKFMPMRAFIIFSKLEIYRNYLWGIIGREIIERWEMGNQGKEVLSQVNTALLNVLNVKY